VERIAPVLIRMPNAAVWCVQQQSDMRAIVLVTEIILDNAKVFFREGWEARGEKGRERVVEESTDEFGMETVVEEMENLQVEVVRDEKSPRREAFQSIAEDEVLQVTLQPATRKGWKGGEGMLDDKVFGENRACCNARTAIHKRADGCCNAKRAQCVYGCTKGHEQRAAPKRADRPLHSCEMLTHSSHTLCSRS